MIIITGSHLVQTTLRKQVSAQIGALNFDNHKITGKDSVCSKQPS